MSVHLQREIERVKKSILALSAIVEDQVQAAVRAMLDRDADQAAKVEHARPRHRPPRGRDRGRMPENPGPAPAGGHRPAVYHRGVEDQ